MDLKATGRQRNGKGDMEFQANGRQQNEKGDMDLQANGRQRNGENILLFTPNLITYARIILVVAMGWFSNESYLIVSALFISDVVLDYADGIAARYLNQCTKFGQVLDVVFDHVTYGLMLTKTYGVCTHPIYRFYIWMQIIVKVGGFQFYSLSSVMSGRTSHKQTAGTSFLLSLYYNPVVLDFCVITMAVFDTAQYLMWFPDLNTVVSIGLVRWIYWCTLPVHIFGMVVYICKIQVAVTWLVDMTVRERDEESRLQAK